MRIKRITLTGFMGAGKSTVGVILAERLSYPFYDSDCVIAQKSGMDIPEIFRRFGESGFRRIEAEAIAEICRNESFVLATGGGAVLSPGNRAALQDTFRVYLRLSEAELTCRLSRNAGNRPLIGGDSVAGDVSRLMQEREGVYTSFASLMIDADGLSPLEVCEEIITRLRADR